jgi:hypothetical protein
LEISIHTYVTLPTCGLAFFICLGIGFTPFGLAKAQEVTAPAIEVTAPAVAAA